MNTASPAIRSNKKLSLIATLGKATAAVVAVGALANALLDLYRAVANIPVSPRDKTNHELFVKHFGELPLFQRTIDIKQAGAVVNLDLELYSGADILVKYAGGVPQWFRAQPASSHGFLSQLAIVSSAHAQAMDISRKRIGVKRSAQAIIQPPIVLDLDKAIVEPEQAVEIAPAKQGVSDRVARAYLLAKTKDDHTSLGASKRTYTEVFRADPGFKIVDHQIQISTASRATITGVKTADDGRSISVTYTIASGPLFDQYRGWIKATVQTSQVPAP